MKMIYLLDELVQKDGVIKNDRYVHGIRNLELKNKTEVFVWCDKNGIPIVNLIDPSGFNCVVLSPKLISDKGWYLVQR